MGFTSRKELSSKEGGSSFFQNTQLKCTQQALVYLGMREHNRKELEAKLKQKGYSEDVIDLSLDSLEDSGSLSESRYVESFIRSNNRRHPEGKSLLAQRLAAKGADRMVSKRVLDQVYTREYVSELLARARESVMKKGKAQTEQEIRFCLMKLGFSGSDFNARD